MRALFSIFLLLALSACVNNFDKYYTANGTTPTPYNTLPPSGEIKIISVSQKKGKETLYKMLENGYSYIGNSSFNGELGDKAQLKTVAKKVGAELVVYATAMTDKESKTFALSTPDTQTTYHSGSFNDYSSGYSPTYYSGTSTTYTKKTTYIPYTVTNYDQEAMFFAKKRPGGLGLYVRDLTKEQRKQVNSNMGAFVTVVVKDSSAFRANIMQDDILLGIREVPIKDAQHYVELARKEIGQKKVPITFWRDGEIYTLYVDIDDYDFSDLKPQS
ncbi:MAG: PDZ domain-containing protein [Terasakiella sp.]|uniref:PDZ domain-containing protein n=2 Tax=Terasakiella TaxID=196080 RepID=UPI003B009A97